MPHSELHCEKALGAGEQMKRGGAQENSATRISYLVRRRRRSSMTVLAIYAVA